MIHPLADIQSNNIGTDTKIWQFVVILSKAQIGRNCNINSHVFIENDVCIGDNVTVKSGVQLWDGITIKDNVFIGPNVTFTNDLLPRSKQYPERFLITIVEKGASIGANATIIAGNIIGEYAMVGAGSVVTKTIGKNELWVGNPAKHIGYVSDKGLLLDKYLKTRDGTKLFHWLNDKLVEKDD